MKKFMLLVLALLLVFCVSCTKDTGNEIPDDKTNDVVATDTNDKTDETDTTDETEDTSEITLYYSDKDARGLCAETRQIPSDKTEDALYVVTELLKGTKSENLVNTIPSNTKVNSCAVSDKTCTLDLSSDFISKQGTANEQLAIYSVVNTLCSLDGVDEVQFLIDGQKVMIFGSYIFDEPFSFDDTVVR